MSTEMPEKSEKPEKPSPLHIENMNGVKGFLESTPKDIEAIVEFESVNKTKTLRRIDLRIMPVLTILYLFSFLDRGYVNLSGKGYGNG